MWRFAFAGAVEAVTYDVTSVMQMSHSSPLPWIVEYSAQVPPTANEGSEGAAVVDGSGAGGAGAAAGADGASWTGAGTSDGAAGASAMETGTSVDEGGGVSAEEATLTLKLERGIGLGDAVADCANTRSPVLLPVRVAAAL